jgi:hypothetical protein
MPAARADNADNDRIEDGDNNSKEGAIVHTHKT